MKSQGKQALFIQAHNTDLIYIIMLIASAQRQKRKKAAAGQSLLMPKYISHGGFDFQSRRFYALGG